jgi:glycosyltransferase involved in cell wall biosynthesis
MSGREETQLRSVVLLCQELVTGGAQRQVIEIARGLRQRGTEVTVLTFYPGGELLPQLLAAGVPCVSLDKGGRWDLIGFTWRLVRVLRRLRPQAVYGFMAVANVLLVLLRPVLPRTAVVWGVRSTDLKTEHYDWLLARFIRLESALARFADLVVCNSYRGRDDAAARGFPSRRLRVIGNGIDVETFTFDAEGRRRRRAQWGIGDDQLLVGLPARLDPMKDHGSFLRAAQAVRCRLPHARFVCVGSGPPDYERRLHSLADELELGRAVVWAGELLDMRAAYSAMDVVVSSSSFGEGFSNAIGEAMACARPCVVTDVGDSARLVGDAGIVVAPESPAALAEAIVQAASDRGSVLGAQARLRAQRHFSVEVLVERTANVLHEAVWPADRLTRGSVVSSDGQN